MYGHGLVKGLLVVFKNFYESYYKSERMVTIQYPEVKRPLAPRMRSFPFLIHDDDSQDLRCTGCGICARACPLDCIALEKARDEEGKPLKLPAFFQINFGICMSCGMCVEACPFSALAMDHTFELASYDRKESLVYGIERLSKPYSYLGKINPEAAAAMIPKKKKVVSVESSGGKP